MKTIKRVQFKYFPIDLKANGKAVVRWDLVWDDDETLAETFKNLEEAKNYIREFTEGAAA